MRFHIFGLPHTVTNAEFCACAYTQKVRKFAKMMGARGHEVIHYGHPDSDVPGASECVGTLTRETFKKVYGDHDFKGKFFKFDQKDPAYLEFYKKTIEEVGKRKQKGDFLLPFWGWGHKPICDAHPDNEGTFVVEPGIGYSSGHFAHYKIFESYALFHAYCGLECSSHINQISWYDVVIPNYFDESEFEYSDEKEDYMLFLGRIYDGKGINIAIQIAEHTGQRLVVAGQNGDEFLAQSRKLKSNIEFVGYADIPTRKKLMAKASSFILASKYLEPFGGTMVEALLSGTPVISTDWGAMTENNLHGVTGYRCRTFDQFVWASQNINRIRPSNCHLWGRNFLFDSIAPAYEEFFQMIHDNKKPKAWYHLNEGRTQLDWMTKLNVGHNGKSAAYRGNLATSLWG